MKVYLKHHPSACTWAHAKDLRSNFVQPAQAKLGLRFSLDYCWVLWEWLLRAYKDQEGRHLTCRSLCLTNCPWFLGIAEKDERCWLGWHWRHLGPWLWSFPIQIFCLGSILRIQLPFLKDKSKSWPAKKARSISLPLKNPLPFLFWDQSIPSVSAYRVGKWP